MFKDKSNLSTKASRSLQYPSVVIGLLISSLTWSNISTERNEKIEHKFKPLLFEQNMGQYDSKIKYLSRGKGYSIALGLQPVIELFRYETTDTKQNFRLNDLDDLPRDLKIVDHSILRMHISNANPKANVIAQDKAVTISNYLTGLKPHWKVNIPNFKSVRYEEILKNIDVIYYGNDGRFEYDFIIKPNANVADIAFNFDGVNDISINEDGQLLLDLGNHKIIQKKPIAYQLDKNGEKQLIAVNYYIESGKVGFNIGKYDTTKDLIVDPVLEYSRYYGGFQNDTVYALDVDASDNIYMIGLTASPDLATIGAYQEDNSLIRNEDTRILDCFYCGMGEIEKTHIDTPITRSIFITKFTPDGNTAIWSTYFAHQDGKPLFLGVNSAAVSANGEVAFGLVPHTPDLLPLVNPTQTIPLLFGNAYIAKLNNFGNDIVFSTYLNVGSFGRLIGLDVSTDGSVVASGGVDLVTANFPEINPLPGQSCDPEEGENFDGWVTHFDSSGTATFSSCLGGAIRSGFHRDFLRGVTIGSNNHIYTVGYSAMTDFPVVNPIQANQSFPGNRDTTITEIDHINSEIVFSTYLGPVRNGHPRAFFKNLPIDIEVDANGNIFVIGVTSYVGWPHINAFQPNLNTTNIRSIPNYPSIFSFSDQIMNLDIYLTKINPSSADIIFSTYLGGSGGERYYPILALDSTGNSYVFAMTDSVDYPLANPIQTSRMGKVSSAISQFSPQGALMFSSYLGGNDNISQLFPGGMAINSQYKLILSTTTQTDDFPVVNSETTHIFGYDATLSIIDLSVDNNNDGDGDGVIDSLDAFPDDMTEWLDTDSNHIGNNTDDDDDSDGVLDLDDIFPLDASESLDSDNDGIGDNADTFPNDPDLSLDSFSDSDSDGVDNLHDFRPFDSTRVFDIDGDGIADFDDLDDDGDGINDTIDIAPTNADDPILTFNHYHAHNVDIYRSFFPANFSNITGSDVIWTSASDDSFSGSTSLSNRIINDNQNAGLQYDDEFDAGEISFQYKIDSEEGFDFFTFAIDDVILLTASGQIPWTEFSTSVAAGSHKLTWEYSKNESNSVGADAVWIDDIKGTPAAAVDLTLFISSHSDNLVNGDIVDFTFTVTNQSTSPTVNALFQVTIPSVLTNPTLTCNPRLKTLGSRCNTLYASINNKQENEANGTDNINHYYDLAPWEKLTFTLSAEIMNISNSELFSIMANVAVDTNIREINTDNNSVSHSFMVTSDILFANSFE